MEQHVTNYSTKELEALAREKICTLLTLSTNRIVAQRNCKLERL